MSFFASPRFLRNVLFVDAASCAATGALQLAFTDSLSQMLNLPSALMTGTGWFLLAYTATVAFIATRDPIPRALVWLLVAGNFGWAIGCGALLASGFFAPTSLGIAWIAAQAVTVVVLGELQWMGLRRNAVAGWS